jgi:endoglucanase
MDVSGEKANMKNLLFAFPLVLMLSSCMGPAKTSTQPPPQPILVSTATPVPMTPTIQIRFPDAFTAVQTLGRGVNLGNALEAPSEGDWGVVIKEEFFARIKDAGFDSVRIPVRWSAHAGETAPYTIDPEFFARVDQVVNWALARDLQVVLNVHHYEEMATDPTGNRERYLRLWTQIAEHYQKFPPALVFELMNEPNGALDSRQWNSISAEALQVVRTSNPQRNVVIGGASWNAYDQLQYLELPGDDPHLIATFHYYNPFQFTHQNAEWVPGSSAWAGTTWDATEAEKAEITRHFDQVAAWAKEHNRPILLGEFGAYSKADMASRARWTDFVAREAERHGFAWSYWEFCSGFGVYDQYLRQWNEPILKALIP